MYSRDEMETYASAHPPHDARAAAMIRQVLASEERLRGLLERAEAQLCGLYKGIAPNGDFASRDEVVIAIREALK